MGKSQKVHICGTDWLHEIGESPDEITVYQSSINGMKKNSKCIENGCGVVELEVKFSRWVKPKGKMKTFSTEDTSR